jgi:hypothetical protein
MNLRMGWVAISLGVALHAQRPAERPEPVIWDGANLLVQEGSMLVTEHPDGTREGGLRIPAGPTSYDFFEGAYWYTSAHRASTPTMKDGRLSTLYRRVGRNWEAYGEFEYANGLVRYLRPLGNGKIWAFSPRSGVFKDTEGYSYPLAILARNPSNGQLSVQTTMDLDLGQPYFQRAKGANNRNGTDTPYSGLAFDMLSPLVFRTSSYLVLCLPDSGFFWVFDAETGHLKRRAKLYGSVTEDLISTHYHDLAPTIIAAQPRSDGKILISARSEDAVQQAARVYREQLPVIESDRAFMQNYPQIKELWDLNLKMFPRVVWWTFDPQTGSVKEEVPPMNFPTLVRSFEELNAYRWQLKPDGNLIYLGEAIPEAPPRPKEAKEPGPAKTAPKVNPKR